MPHQTVARAGRSPLLCMLVALATTTAPLMAARPRATPAPPAPPGARFMDPRHAVVPRSLAIALFGLGEEPAGRSRRSGGRTIPSFSRQTKLACSACHYQFLQLTPFGRRFKLNGYTLSGLQSIPERAPEDSSPETLRLASIPPVSAMAIASFSQVAKKVPGTQNSVATFPDQLSLFLGGAVTPKVGAFAQLTYAAPDATVGIDNVDLRFASQATVASRELVYGVTLHNNPTVQDLWNTVPAWTFPFVSSPVSPTPAAAPLVDGALGQQVVGLGAYGLWNQLLYAELTAYRSAPQGGAQPADGSAVNTTHGVSPYWRVALQRQLGPTYVMVGTYGLVGTIYPTGVSGPTNRYTDVAGDVQLERSLGANGSAGELIIRSSLIHEKQRLDAFIAAEEPGAANATNTLTSFRVNASYQPSLHFDLTLGYFDVSGSSDPLLYPQGDVTGSATGQPNSSGAIAEIDVNPWQNMRLGAQYVAYGKFNGGSSSYDGAGRNASDNNTLYLFTWLVF